ncbi:hypothetical protein [Faecalispora sporosphaeroides]|uniref:hypothetical protein n=1 Tax=Faecalispora sporosphaeroides TaxID=1549 RepID=UPI0003666BFE|nr:hypothetical protein [Faecalispora sporosphaeroides]
MADYVSDYYGISMRIEQERLEEEKRKDILLRDIMKELKSINERLKTVEAKLDQ